MKARFQAITVQVFRAVPGIEIREHPAWTEVEMDALPEGGRETLELHVKARNIMLHPHDGAAFGRPTTAVAGTPDMAAPPASTMSGSKPARAAKAG